MVHSQLLMLILSGTILMLSVLVAITQFRLLKTRHELDKANVELSLMRAPIAGESKEIDITIPSRQTQVDKMFERTRI